MATKMVAMDEMPGAARCAEGWRFVDGKATLCRHADGREITYHAGEHRLTLTDGEGSVLATSDVPGPRPAWGAPRDIENHVRRFTHWANDRTAQGEGTATKNEADPDPTAQPAEPKRRFRVAVTELDEQRRVHEAVVVADDESEAKGLGLAKLFGKSAFWFADSGLPGGHWGQVFRPLRGGGNNNTSLTPRARLDVETA